MLDSVLPTASDAGLLDSLRARIAATLDPRIREKRVALLDFPDHPNVGDSLIWLGSVDYLTSRGIEIAYTCDQLTYSRRVLRERIGDGLILLVGGGNFGDLWPQNQEFRERVLADFPSNPILQLPQSIHFNDAAPLRRARERVQRHRRFTLLVRDHQSLTRARDELGCDAVLCPDMALHLRPRPRRRPSTPVLWLGRNDKEKAPSSVDNLRDIRVHRTDWIRERITPAIRLYRLLVAKPSLRRLRGTTLRDAQLAAARERAARGQRLLSRGRVVVTDRLHAHILCLLLGIPNVVLDNSYGKVHAFYETWTRPCSFAFPSHSADAALAIAARLAGC